MKRLIVLIFILAITGCSQVHIISKDFKAENMIHYSRLGELENASALDRYAVYLDKGDTFPLKLSFDTGILGISNKNIDMMAKQKLFFMLKLPENMSKEKLAELENLDKKKLSEMSESDKRKFFTNFMLYVSKDASEWAPVSDIKAIKKVLGSKGGTISFGMGMSTKEGVWSYLDVEEVR